MNNRIWFYNRFGEPQIYLYELNRFYDVDGNNLGYIVDNQYLYNYNGRHCGWIEGYVIRDLYGFVVGFSQFSNDYPVPIFPIRQLTPFPAIKQITPIKAIRQIPYIKPIKMYGWSNLDLINLFA